MSKHNETGIKGEEIAGNFLLKNGYAILQRNWCFGKKEVDIIAKKGDILIFIEVKTRSNFDFGFPEEAVTAKKQSFLKIAAEAYIEANPEHNTIRFDIISVLLDRGNIKEILHFEDAFF
ncbi:MAG TPA: YraN family protein [Flavipsychrobacter sp.]|nr:YraN family protein [Flavipsychrobacter sp.]